MVVPRLGVPCAQVKSKLPEQQQYIKVTCYHGDKDSFRNVCADLFRQVPL